MASPVADTSGQAQKLLLVAINGNLELLKKIAAEFDRGKGLAQTLTDIKDDSGRTALHAAAAGGQTHICKYLVKVLNLDVNMKDGEGYTPLDHAISQKYPQTAEFLLENGSDPKLTNGQGFSALHHAAEQGFKELVLLLIFKGAEVDANSDFGTPLHCAAAHGKTGVVKILLDQKANPNLVSHQTFTTLGVAILGGWFECTSLLLKAGADPNIGSQGGPPLAMAAYDGKTELIKCLLKAGADPNVTTFDGLTPLEISAQRGLHEAVMILLPGTSRIPSIPDWSLSGIIKHVHTEKGRRQTEQRKKDRFLLSKTKGEEAFKKKNYLNAIYWYTQAITAVPSDATVLSNRSLCWARLNEGGHALTDAETCVMLRPDWAKAHYREGVAWSLLKNFHKAAEAFSEGLKLDPDNKELKIAFREAIQAEFGLPVA